MADQERQRFHLPDPGVNTERRKLLSVALGLGLGTQILNTMNLLADQGVNYPSVVLAGTVSLISLALLRSENSSDQNKPEK